VKTQNIKEELNEDMEKPQKKESNGNPGNKKSLMPNKKPSGKPIQQTRNMEDRSQD
jgi:hypothetical protein